MTRIKLCQEVCGFDIADYEERNFQMRQAHCPQCGVRWFKSGSNFVVRKKPEETFGEWDDELHGSMMGQRLNLLRADRKWAKMLLEVPRPTRIGGMYVDVDVIWFHKDWLENFEGGAGNCQCPIAFGCTCGAFVAEQEAKGMKFDKWGTKTWYDPKERNQ